MKPAKIAVVTLFLLMAHRRDQRRNAGRLFLYCAWRCRLIQRVRRSNARSTIIAARATSSAPEQYRRY